MFPVNRISIIFFRVISFVLIFSFFSFSLYSQSESSDTNTKLEALLDSALCAADQGNWELALSMLDDAEKLAPDDPRISSYRTSIQELSALDEAQQSWSEGIPAEVESPDSNVSPEEGGDGDDETPKFVIDRGEDDRKDPPSNYRDVLRLDLGIKTFAVNPFTSETLNTWSSSNEFFYSSLRADFRYWMPFLGRSLGFNFRSNGYSWVPGDPDTLFNALDLGINLRGFLLESKLSRLELGLDFGGSMLTTIDVDTGKENNWALYLGLWLADPLFYHIFQAESLERLVFGGGIRIYSSNTQTLLETINYRIDSAWYFKRGFSGIRFEWWNFSIDTRSINVMSFSLFGGFRY